MEDTMAMTVTNENLYNKLLYNRKGALSRIREMMKESSPLKSCSDVAIAAALYEFDRPLEADLNDIAECAVSYLNCALCNVEDLKGMLFNSSIIASYENWQGYTLWECREPVISGIYSSQKNTVETFVLEGFYKKMLNTAQSDLGKEHPDCKKIKEAMHAAMASMTK